MVYKNFYINSIIRIILLSLSIFLLFFILYNHVTHYYITLGIIFLLIIYQLYALFKVVNKIIKQIITLFDSIKNSDFTSNLTLPYHGKPFSDLNNSFSYVINKIKTFREENEKQFRYLQNVIHHIGIGLISFKQNGEVDLINNAAKKMIKVIKHKNVNQIRLANRELEEKLLRIKHNQKQLVKFTRNDEFFQIIVYATDFYLGNNRYRLVSIQDIQKELEEKEIESWEKLIHVLTHEIMNSITPISSLASTTQDLIKTCVNNCYQVDTTATDTLRAIQTIKKRSDGLLHFVKNYRELTGLPTPEPAPFEIKELFTRVENLMHAQLKKKNIVFTCEMQYPEFKLTADINLVEQILINLIKNSFEAVSTVEEPEIKLFSSIDDQARQVIQLTDNGRGISEEMMEKIFIPFFTTKEAGTGIGLNICRQIMWMHGGSLRMVSEQGVKTTFSLIF